MSKYISSQFYSYDIEVNTDVNTGDLKRVMCYIVKSRSTIFFNVHFAFGKTLIFKRQTELYNFMNAIVYSIRSIPQSKTELYPYQNYDIVFTGDFNLNMLQRFPQDIKRFGYPDNNNMIPIFLHVIIYQDKELLFRQRLIINHRRGLQTAILRTITSQI